MKLFICTLCKKVFKSRHSLTRHADSVHSKTKFTCSQCHVQFARKDILDTHVKTHHTEETPFKCKHCGKCVSSNYALTCHERSHTGERPFKCSLCPKSFAHPQQYKDHVNRHNGIRPHKCHLCSKSFGVSGELKQHLNYHEGKRPFQCEICKRTFSQHSHWKIHLRGHYGEKPYNCRFCPMTFRQSAHLRVHQSAHTGEKKFECGVCKERFRLAHTLKSHIRRHTGEKPYKCPFCPRAFSQSSPRNHHIKSFHEGETYPCGVCGKTFPTESQLKTHGRIHLKRERFVCVFCDKADDKMSDHFQHIRAHIQESPNHCGKCDKWFRGHHSEKKCTGRKQGEAEGKEAVFSEELPIPIPIVIPGQEFALEEEAQHVEDRDQLDSQPVPIPVLSQAYPEMDVVDQQVLQTEKQTIVKKIYKCPICNEVMRHSNHLNGHMNIHKVKGSTVKSPDVVKMTAKSPETVKVATGKLPKTTEEPSPSVSNEAQVIFNSFDGDVRSKRQRKQVLNSIMDPQSETPPKKKLLRCELCPNKLFGNAGALGTHRNMVHLGVKKIGPKQKQQKEESFVDEVPVEYELPDGDDDEHPMYDPLADDNFVADNSFMEDDIEIEYGTEEDQQEYAAGDESTLQEVKWEEENDEENFGCELRIDSIRHLDQHEMKLMSNYRPYQCKDCNKMYRTTEELDRHRTFHGIFLPPTSPGILDGAQDTPESTNDNTCEITVEKTEKLKIPDLSSMCPPEILEIFDDDDEEPPEPAMPRLNVIEKSNSPPPPPKRIKFTPDEELPPKLEQQQDPVDDNVNGNMFDRVKRKGAVVKPEEGPYDCNVCKRSFTNPALLGSHMKIHSDYLDILYKRVVSGNAAVIKPPPPPALLLPLSRSAPKTAKSAPSPATSGSSPPPAPVFKKKKLRCNFCKRQFGNQGALAIHKKRVHADKLRELPFKTAPTATAAATAKKTTPLKKAPIPQAEAIADPIPPAPTLPLLPIPKKKKKWWCKICRRFFKGHGGFGYHNKMLHSKDAVPTNSVIKAPAKATIPKKQVTSPPPPTTPAEDSVPIVAQAVSMTTSSPKEKDKTKHKQSQPTTALQPEAKKFKCKFCPKLFANPGARGYHTKKLHMNAASKATIQAETAEPEPIPINLVFEDYPEDDLVPPVQNLSHQPVPLQRKRTKKQKRNGKGRFEKAKFLKTKMSCDICNQIFGNKGALGFHKKKKHSTVSPNGSDFITQEPPANTSESVAIVAGIVDEHSPVAPINPKPTSTTEKRYKCILCSFVTTDKTSLANHAQSVHYKGNTHACDLCSMTFPSQMKLTAHMEEKHSDETPIPIPLDICY